MVNQLFSGVQMNHIINHTTTSSEGYGRSISDLNNMPILEYDDSLELNDYYNLNPGLYQVHINGTLYVLMIHDVLSGGDRLIIKNGNDAYYLTGTHMHKIFLYKFSIGQYYEPEGMIMDHSVNAPIDLIVMDGVTETTSDKVDNNSIIKPRSLECMSMVNIQVSNENGEFKNYPVHFKNYLKSITVGDYKICDTIYIESATLRSSIILRLGRLVLNGEESIEFMEGYSTENVVVFRYSNSLVKPKAKMMCSHLPLITWEQMTFVGYQDNGICAGDSDDDRAIYFKLNTKYCKNLDDFRAILNKWYYMTKDEVYEELHTLDDDISYKDATIMPFTICYELANVEYKSILLDAYNINTYFNKSWIIVTPYNTINKYKNYSIDDLASVISELYNNRNYISIPADNDTVAVKIENGEIPEEYDDTLINLIIRNMVYLLHSKVHIMLFYKHIRFN